MPPDALGAPWGNEGTQRMWGAWAQSRDNLKYYEIPRGLLEPSGDTGWALGCYLRTLGKEWEL